MKIHGYAALKPKGSLCPFSYEKPPLAPFEILVKTTHCGLCHSDIHLIDNDWNRSNYPLIPGHEIIGTVEEKGSEVESVEIGDRIGVSWIKSSCLSCDLCLSGDTNICAQKTTICNGHFGGFADHVIADSRFVFPIPSTIDSAHAAPLLCAGATVYAPMHRFNLQSHHSVAIIGIGGLGHLAVQFAAAFGAKVTAISTSPSKEAEAKSFGATEFLSLNENLRENQFDLILSTVSADLDWNQILSLLKPKGTLHFVGRPKSTANIDLSALISPHRVITGSSTANRSTMNEMLAFAARKNIQPKIELLPLSKVNEGVERLKTNRVRYRIVFQTSC